MNLSPRARWPLVTATSTTPLPAGTSSFAADDTSLTDRPSPRSTAPTLTDPWEPWRLVDGDGVVVESVAAYLRDLQAAGRSMTTARSYALDLLRWFPVPLGGRGWLGSGDPGRGPRLLPVAAGRGQADAVSESDHPPVAVGCFPGSCPGARLPHRGWPTGSEHSASRPKPVAEPP